jgi:predicted PurR-regulated permease PerM
VTASWGARLFQSIALTIVAVATVALALVVLTPFLPAIAWAIVLAVGLRAPWKALEQRLVPHRNLAAALATIITVLVVLVPAGLVASTLFGQATLAVGYLREQLKTRQITSFSGLVALPWISEGLSWIEGRTGITPDVVESRAVEWLAAVSSFVAAKSGGFLLGFVEALTIALLTMFLLFFLLRDGDEMAAALTDLLPLEARERDRIVGALSSMLQSIFLGSIGCAMVQGATGAIGWAFAGLPSPILAGTMMAVLSLLPIGGAAIVWLPGAIWLFASGRAGAAIFLFLWGLIVTSFLADNVLRPFLVRGRSQLNTLMIFVGVVGGVATFGLLGIFIGPMSLALAAMVLEVLKTLAREARESKPDAPN